MISHPRDNNYTDIEAAEVCNCNRDECECEFIEAHEDMKCPVYCPICERERLKMEEE